MRVSRNRPTLIDIAISYKGSFHTFSTKAKHTSAKCRLMLFQTVCGEMRTSAQRSLDLKQIVAQTNQATLFIIWVGRYVNVSFINRLAVFLSSTHLQLF